ncbi:hypothetical protein T484DRAFT_1776119, partial [Baffinella frigidus]
VRFDVAGIGQSSPYPCDNNTITVTLSTDLVALAACHPRITLSGLENAQAMDGMIPVVPAAGGFAAEGVWATSDSSGSIVVDIVDDLAANIDYVFAFTVVNPRLSQTAVQTTVTLDGIFLDGTSAKDSRDVLHDTGDAAGIYHADHLRHFEVDALGNVTMWAEGTANPMYVREIAFEAGQEVGLVSGGNKTRPAGRYIHNTVAAQSSELPCHLNTITVTLRTNAPLIAGCSPRVTLSGLSTTMTDGGRLNITGPEEFAMDGAWNRPTGTLVFDVVKSTAADTDYVLTVEVRNTNKAQAYRNLTVQASLAGDAGTPELANARVVRSVWPRDAQTMYVVPTVFTRMTVENDNPLPCSINTVRVKFATNVPLHLFCHPLIEVKGLSSTTTAGDTMMEVRDCSAGGAVMAMHGAWTEAGTLIVGVNATTAAGTEYCFEWDVRNKEANTYADPYKLDLHGIELGPLSNTSLNVLPQTWDNTWLVPAVNTTDTGVNVGWLSAGSFVVHNASQSSPYPCTSNRITVFFATDKALMRETLITIAGLSTTQTSDGVLPLAGPDGSMFNGSGVWTQATGTLTLRINVEKTMPGTAYMVAFDVINPTAEETGASRGASDRLMQVAKTVTIEASATCVVKKTLTPDEAVLPLYAAMPGDAAPLQIHRAAWLKKEIGQSTPYPGAVNTITVTLSTNVPLTTEDCPTSVWVEIYGLDDKSLTSTAWGGAHLASGASYDLVAPNGNKTFNYPNGVMIPSPNEADILLQPLQSMCTVANDTNDHTFFQDASGSSGKSGVAKWATGYLTSRVLTIFPRMETMPNNNYVFSFDVVNPVVPSATVSGLYSHVSPDITIKAHGIDLDGDNLESSTTAIAMDKDAGAPCCTSCTPTGKAELGDSMPLQVYDASFCTKTIGQSTANPCELNTLTVTLTANVPLTAQKSIITLSGFTNADEATGPIPILDAFAGLNNHLYFGAQFVGQEPGTGHWNNESKTLTLYLLKDTEPASDLYFAFKLFNPPSAQASATIQVEASWVGHSRDVYASSVTGGVAIAILDMAPTVTAGTYPERAPMMVIAATFAMLSATQSSDVPCDNNTITVTFQTDVPMWSRCTPIMTFAGFKNAHAAVGIYDEIAIYGPASERLAARAANNYPVDDSRPNDNGNITDMANFGVWDNSLGSETLQVWVVSDLEALTDYTFSFEVVNPAEGQTAPALSAVAIGIPAASFSPTGRRLLDHEGEGSPAMTVAFLNYDENLISQRSPWPCDDNTITVLLTANRPLLSKCQPMVTISNLRNTRTLDGMLPVNFMAAGIVWPNASWAQAPGTLVFDLGEVDNSTGLVDISRISNISLAIDVSNPEQGVANQPVTVKTKVTCLGCKGTRTWEQTIANDNSTSDVDFSMAVSPVVPRVSDAWPMNIRPAGFVVKTIKQSSPYPCDENNVLSVELASAVPLFLSKCSTPVMLTIRGLDGADTATGHLATDLHPDASTGSAQYGATAFWRKEEGTIEWNITADVVAGTTFSMRWKVTNQAAGKNAVDVGVKVTPQMSDAETAATPGLVGTTTFLTPEYAIDSTWKNIWNATAQDLAPMFIRSFEIWASANQTSP